MKDLRWNLLKSKRLKQTRGVSFEKLVQAKVIAVRAHPKNPKQELMLLEYQGYIWVVPFIETEEEIFLKTLYPSRKFTKFYRGRRP